MFFASQIMRVLKRIKVRTKGAVSAYRKGRFKINAQAKKVGVAGREARALIGFVKKAEKEGAPDIKIFNLKNKWRIANAKYVLEKAQLSILMDKKNNRFVKMLFIFPQTFRLAP
jgi:hypothetical protein